MTFYLSLSFTKSYSHIYTKSGIRKMASSLFEDLGYPEKTLKIKYFT